MYRYQPPPMGVGKATDVGKKRKENQDSMAYLELDKLFFSGAKLLVVADGMGGALGGKVASETAVKAIEEFFKKDDIPGEPDLAILQAIEYAAEAVDKKALSEPDLKRMGTTCLVAMVHNGYLFAGHVGDSRLYLWRNGKIHRMTRDHSRVQFLIEAGIIDEKDAENHPHQSILARVLGSQEKPIVEILAPPRKLQEGDRILLCSDGLYNEVPEEKIAAVLAETTTKNTQQMAEKLVEMANEHGGNDNITVQILAYGEARPLSEGETWFSFQNPIAAFAFLFLLALLFFGAGYFVGRYHHPPEEESKLEQPVETVPSNYLKKYEKTIQ